MSWLLPEDEAFIPPETILLRNSHCTRLSSSDFSVSFFLLEDLASTWACKDEVVAATKTITVRIKIMVFIGVEVRGVKVVKRIVVLPH